MANIIYSPNLITVADANIAARNPDGGDRLKANVMVFDELGLVYRCGDATADDYLFVFDFLAAQTVAGIFLNNVNFNKVMIEGHTADSWGAPDFSLPAAATISQNQWTRRYQVYIPLTSFNYRYLRVYIPAGTSAVGSYTAKWQISSVAMLSSVTQLSKNISRDYTETAVEFISSLSLPHGGSSDIKRGDNLQWQGTILPGTRSKAEFQEIQALNAVRKTSPLVFYLNNSDTSEAYLCKKDGNFSGSYITNGLIQGTGVRFLEYM